MDLIIVTNKGRVLILEVRYQEQQIKLDNNEEIISVLEKK